METKVIRSEHKYIIDKKEESRLKMLFSSILFSDEYSANGSYMVRSLYFDTIDDKDFHDKLNEQNVRKKIRLRIYDPKQQNAKLEIKEKINTAQLKRSITISREDALRLIDKEYSVLLKYGDALAAEIYSIMVLECYEPKCIVEYQRHAFIRDENNVRITFDTDINACEYNFDLYSPNLVLSPVFDYDRLVLEVKYDKFLLQYIADEINKIDRKTVSFSKYVYGRKIAYPLSI